MHKARWNSLYHQVIEILSTEPRSVLEIGVGSGISGTILKKLACPYESMDFNPELHPDHLGSVLKMPFPDRQYDTVACFQVLEHLPYEQFSTALSELFRVARGAVILSLPDAGRIIQIHIPRLCKKRLIDRPFAKKKEHQFDGEHYWEINKKGYEISRITTDMKKKAEERNFYLEKEYRVWENPYHHFFIFKPTRETGSA